MNAKYVTKNSQPHKPHNKMNTTVIMLTICITAKSRSSCAKGAIV